MDVAMDGWIKLHRKIRQNEIFNDHQLLRLWLICLTEASHKERDQIVGKQTVHLMPGEFVTGRFDIADMYNLGLKSKEKVKGEKTVFRWLETLENLGFLTIKKTNKFSIVSISNWSLYQQTDQENDQQKTNKRPTNDQQMTTNKNVKNVKNDKNVENVKNKRIKDKTAFEDYTSNPALIDSLNSFLEFRKKIKKTMTDKAITLLLGNLDKLATDDQGKIEILNQSILNGWQSVYPLKEKTRVKGNDRKPNISIVESTNEQPVSEEELAELMKLAEQMKASKKESA